MSSVMLAGNRGQLLIGHKVYHYPKVEPTVCLKSNPRLARRRT